MTPESQIEPTTVPSRQWLNTPRFGLALVVVASCFFGVMGIFVKSLSGRVPLAQLACMRGVIAFVPLTAGMLWAGVPIRTKQWPALGLRGGFGLGAMLCYFWALATIPLADAVVLNYTAPLFTATLAITLLGERLNRRSIALLGLACLGVVMVMQPSFSGSPSGYAVALSAGLFSGAAFTTVKYLTARHSAWIIVWYFSLVSFVCTAPFAIASWRAPSGSDWGRLAAISVLGTSGQLLMTLGFRRATVSHASAGTLFVLVVTTLGGWWIWNEVPGWLSGVGMVCVAAAITGLSRELRKS